MVDQMTKKMLFYAYLGKNADNFKQTLLLPKKIGGEVAMLL